MPANYPIVLEVSDRQVAIIGGGAVALRKAEGLIDAGATKIKVVAPLIRDEFPPTIERVHAEYQPAHLAGATLVFATTDSAEVNGAVVRDCRARSILVNRADADTTAGDFVTPATMRDGPLLVSISTGGFAALAARVRDELKQHMDPRWRLLADAMQALRPILRQVAELDAEGRRLIFLDLVSEPALCALSDGHTDGLLNWLAGRWPQVRHVIAGRNR